MTAAVTTAIDITTLEASFQVVFCGITSGCSSRKHTLGIVNPRVPLQSLRMVVLVNPTLGLHFQTREVQDDLVAVGIWFTQQTAKELGIQAFLLVNVSLVTATNHLVVNDDLISEGHLNGTIDIHTTDITAAIERAKHGGIWLIFTFIVEHDTRHDTHRHTIHICCKLALVSQVHLAKIDRCAVDVDITGILLQDILGYHVRTIVTQEHLVGNHIRANFQLCRSILIGIVVTQCGTVTATEESSTNNRLLRCRCTYQADRHGLGIGTEGIQSFDGRSVALSCLEVAIIQVAICRIILQFLIISIGIGTIATTIEVTPNAAIDTDGITAIHLTGNVVATIDVVDITTMYQHTS